MKSFSPVIRKSIILAVVAFAIAVIGTAAIMYWQLHAPAYKIENINFNL